jgi:hypothetical protein
MASSLPLESVPEVITMRTMSIVVTAFFCLAISSCDFSPTSSFEGFDGDGASLSGSFEGSTSAGSGVLKSQAAPAASAADALTVVVYDEAGNELGSVDVHDGKFSLRGLPETFVLQFKDESGNTLGDPMTFAGVSPNQEVEIVVELQGSEVVLIEETRTGIGHDGGIELEGLAQNVVYESGNAMNGSLEVNGHHVLSRGAEIRKGNRSLTLADLENGDRVHVRGSFEGDDVLAREIMLQNEAEDEDGDGSAAACNYRDPAKPNHILICHKGQTLSVSPDAWQGHAGHGDTCGPCQ